MIPPELLALALLFAVNRLVLPRFLRVAPVFWLVNALNLGAAVLIYVRGFPRMEGDVAVRLLVGTLLLFHIAQNLALRSRARDVADLGPGHLRERIRAAHSDLPDRPAPSGPSAPPDSPDAGE